MKINWKNKNNPYKSLPRMVMMTYQLPEQITQITSSGEYNEFDFIDNIFTDNIFNMNKHNNIFYWFQEYIFLLSKLFYCTDQNHIICKLNYINI